MITVENLSRRYGDVVAVDDVSFSIGRGEIVGLLGHNGAGKTTIMKMLTGTLEPSTGRLEVSEFDLARQRQQAQALIGYLPENLPVYPEMTVADYLDYCARLRGLGDGCGAAVCYAVDQTDLRERALDPISTLSRGYRQRVGVAQALLHKPSLLVLDEPTNGLDPHQTRHMRSLIRRLAEDATIILSTHILQEVDAVCDRVLIVNHGRLVVDSEMKDIRTSQELRLDTDADAETVNRVLQKAGGAKPAELISDAPKRSYRIPLTGASNADTLSASLAAGLVEAGFGIYSVFVPHRDLETVFRELEETWEAKDAA